MQLSRKQVQSTFERNSQRGIMLLEALIAILIFSVGVLAIIGLQAATFRATTESKMRIDASSIANQRISMMWLDRTNIAAYAENNTAVAELPNGSRTTVIAGTQVTITVTWQPPGEALMHSFITIANING